MLACWLRCYRNTKVKKELWPRVAWNLFLSITRILWVLFLFYSSCQNILLHLLDGCTLVALVPPGLGWVQVATPQLPVEALGWQRILVDLKRVIFDVVKRRGDDAGSVFLDSLQDGFSPSSAEAESRFTAHVHVERTDVIRASLRWLNFQIKRQTKSFQSCTLHWQSHLVCVRSIFWGDITW